MAEQIELDCQSVRRNLIRIKLILIKDKSYRRVEICDIIIQTSYSKSSKGSCLGKVVQRYALQQTKNIVLSGMIVCVMTFGCSLVFLQCIRY